MNNVGINLHTVYYNSIIYIVQYAIITLILTL